jgi:proteasome lid subunit RPN8/RPN11
VKPIAIPDRLRAGVYEHACAAYPEECCGYLVGPVGGFHVTGMVQCQNAIVDDLHPTHPERDAENGFVISGRELLAFAKSFATGLPARIVYHSHPRGRAYFSAVDRLNALSQEGPTYPVQHLVIGVSDQKTITEVAQFAWDAELGDFVEVARSDLRC